LKIFSLPDIFKRGRGSTESVYVCGPGDIDAKVQEVYLKRMALDICANFIARAVSQLEVKIDDRQWYYKLNVRPNTDMSAAQFWHTLTYRLIEDNKVLVVKSDSDDLLIADGWTRNEYAVYEDTFSHVRLKDFTFARTFKMNEVLYLEYNNDRLERFTEGLFADYADLYGRLREAAKRNSQIRGTVDVEGNYDPTDEKKRDELQSYVDKLFQAFKSKSIAIAPLFKGFSYKEHSNTTGTSNLNVEEITKIPDYLINTVADALGIPTALLHGSRAELQDNITAFNKFCLPPLLQKIGDELNAKLLDPRTYSKDSRIEVIGTNRPDIFGLAEAIDKLISSSVFNVNEIREELGYDPRAGGDVYVITKNLDTANSTQKGGEKT